MNENENIDLESGFDEFEAAFDGDDGYQTEETEEVTDTEEPEAEEPGEEPSGEGESGEEAGAPQTEEGTEGGKEDPAPAETFTLRVNKEDRTVSREEMIAFAQKGADYDRVKNQLAERDSTIAEMRKSIDGSKDALELLNLISEEVKKPVSELLESLHLSLRMKNGETEAEARANIRAIKAERAMKAAQEKPAQEPKSDGRARAEKEVADFHNRYPGVELTEELCGKLATDVQKGMSLSDAYAKHQADARDAEIAELKRQLEAEKQNNKNRAKAVGSQKDSGGKRGKSPEDDFFAAFDR